VFSVGRNKSYNYYVDKCQALKGKHNPIHKRVENVVVLENVNLLIQNFAIVNSEDNGPLALMGR
jgi:hypothetical protein